MPSALGKIAAQTVNVSSFLKTVLLSANRVPKLAYHGCVSPIRLLLVPFCLFIAAFSPAEILFYGGQAELPATSWTFPVVGDGAAVWDDFDVTGSPMRVTSVFGDFRMHVDLFTPLFAEVEIRSGVNEGNPGTLLFREDEVLATGEPTGRIYDPFHIERRVRVPELDMHLNPGRYWLLVRPVNYDASVSKATGVNGIGSPLLNGNSFFSWHFWGNAFFRSTATINSGNPWDAPYGVEGMVVSEPATLVLLGFGALPILRRRQRRCAARRAGILMIG